MSEDIKWDPSKKDERDAKRECEEKEKSALAKAQYQKKKFGDYYDKWKKDVCRNERTPEEITVMLSQLETVLDKMVTEPSLATWKAMSKTLIAEKAFAMAVLKSGGPESAEPADGEPSGSDAGSESPESASPVNRAHGHGSTDGGPSDPEDGDSSDSSASPADN